MKLKDQLPEIYQPFFPEFQEWDIPEERIATCDNCTLCQSDQSPYLATKCCTYHPLLPNYLVGAILQDGSPESAEGKKRILEKIRQKIGVTPYGILPPVAYQIRFNRKKWIEHQETKEEAESLRCPYFHQGWCTIYKYRNHLCTSFYCHSVGGAAGKHFWDKINSYLRMTERELSKYAMLQIGFQPEDILPERPKGWKIGIDDNKGNFYDEKYRALWKDWSGREVDFYIRCYEVIRKMNASGFNKLTGFDNEILQKAIASTYTKFKKEVIPEYLMLNPAVQVKNIGEGDVELNAGNGTYVLPMIQYMFLKAFNGQRSTTEAYHLGYKALLRLGNLVNDLYEKQILIHPEKTEL